MDTFAANVQGDRAEFGPTSLRRPIAFQASTVRSSQRTVPTVSFHDDFSAHVEGNEAADTCATAETVSQGATRQAGEYSVEFGRSNQGCQPSEEVEKNEGPRSRSERTLDESDLESQSVSLSRQNTATSSQLPAPRDPNLVSWESLDDPRNPKNWSLSRKWATVAIVSAFTFISSLASSMVAPTLPSISADLHITNSILSQMSLSMFVLAYAFGPLLLAPLSELYGRVPVLQLANLVFLVFNLACGFAQDSAQLLVCRFFAGLGGSAPLAVGGGVLGDCFTADQRGQAVALYSLMPLLGPAIGPICGGFIAEYSTWRWAFWSVSIADAVIQGLGVLFLQETWAPKLLAQKTERLRKETGNDALSPMVSNTQITFGKKMRQALARPFIMLFTQPIVVVLTIYRAFLYGLTYLVISTFTTLYTSPQYYGESASIAGLHYIALAIGFLLGAQLASAFNDWLYARLKKRNNGVGKPEFRVSALRCMKRLRYRIPTDLTQRLLF